MFKPMVAMGFTLNKIRAIFYQVGSLITFLGISSGILMGQLLVYFQLRFLCKSEFSARTLKDIEHFLRHKNEIEINTIAFLKFTIFQYIS